MSNILSNFSERLSELMSEEELNPRSIGEDIGHNFYDFYHWKSEKKKYLPRLPVLIEIADYFSCSLEFLLGMEEQISLSCPAKILPPFSERFTWIMQKSGKKFSVLAKEAELSGTSVLYNWKNGVTKPNVYSLIAVARALDCSLDYLIGREI